MKNRKRMKKTRMRSTMTIPEWKNHDAAGDHRCCFNRLCRDLLVGRAVGIFNFGATSAQVTVENVTGKSATEAQKILEDLGLKVKFAYETSDTVAEGNVISQDVQGGTTVSSGTQVQLTVSGTAPASDTDTIPVPDVLGALEADATATLTRSGFTVTKADGYSDTIERKGYFPESGRWFPCSLRLYRDDRDQPGTGYRQ